MDNSLIGCLPTIAVLICTVIIVLIMRRRATQTKQPQKATATVSQTSHRTQASSLALEDRKSKDPQELLRQAEVCLIQQKYDEALKLCQRSLKLNAEISSAYYLLSSVHLAKGDSVEAVQAARHAIELEPGCTGAYVNLGKARRAKGDIDTALKDLTLGLEQGDVNWDYRELATVLAAMHVGKRDYACAVQVLERATKRCPRDGELWYFLGMFSFDGGDYAKAISAYQEALVLGTAASASSGRLHSELGRTYAAQREWEKALEEHRLSIEMEPAEPDHHFWLAETYSKKQDYRSAVVIFEETLQVNPRDARIYSGLGDAYLHLEQYAEAAQVLAQAQSLENMHANTRADIYNLLTVSYIGLKKYEDAVRVGRKALTLRSSTCPTYERDAYYHLGVALHELRRYPEALEQLKTALSLGGRDKGIPSLIHLRLGDIHVAMQNLDKGIEEYRESIKCRENVDAHIRLAGAYIRLTRYQEGLLELQRAMAAGELTEEQKSTVNEYFGRLGAEGYLTPVL